MSSLASYMILISVTLPKQSQQELPQMPRPFLQNLWSSFDEIVNVNY